LPIGLPKRTLSQRVANDEAALLGRGGGAGRWQADHLGDRDAGVLTAACGREQMGTTNRRFAYRMR
jgi:hypothetical protein